MSGALDFGVLADDPFMALAGTMDDATRADYNAFRDQLNDSTLLDGQLTPVLTAVGDVMTAALISYLEKDSAQEIDDLPASVVGAGGVAVEAVSRGVYRMAVKGTVNVPNCDPNPNVAPVVDCAVATDFVVEVDYGSDSDGKLVVGASGGNHVISMVSHRLNIITGTAENSAVKVAFAPAPEGDHVFIPSLDADIIYVDPNADPKAISRVEATTIVEVRGTVFDDPIEINVPMTISSKSGDEALSVALSGGLVLTVDANLENSDAMVVEVARFDLQALTVNAGIVGGAGDELDVALVDGEVAISGGQPLVVTVTDGDQFDVSETETNFLGVSFGADFTSTFAGGGTYALGLLAERTSDTAVRYADMKMVMSGMTYNITNLEVDNDGNIIALNAASSDGISIQVSETGGVRSGTVTDGTTEVGAIAENAEGELVITYSDGSTATL